MDDRTTGESPHELLLALAGRIDDDLLAWCRELVAVGEDARALELITATLIADRTALPAAARAALVGATRTARTDLDADSALAPAAGEDGTAHRFDTELPGAQDLAAAVGALPTRQIAGCRSWATMRTTPAGSAPGPLPQAVVLIEVGAGDTRPVDIMAYQLAIACARTGVPAAVEVVVAGTDRPAYHDAALRSAIPVHGADEPAAAEPAPARVAPARVAPARVAAPELLSPGSPELMLAAQDTGPVPVKTEPVTRDLPSSTPAPAPRPSPRRSARQDTDDDAGAAFRAASAQPVSFDARPSDARPSDARPSDARPSDARPLDARPLDARPLDARPSDAFDSEPFDSEPFESSLFASGPSEPVSFESRPRDEGLFDPGPRSPSPGSSDDAATDTDPTDPDPSSTQPADTGTAGTGTADPGTTELPRRPRPVTALRGLTPAAPRPTPVHPPAVTPMPRPQPVPAPGRRGNLSPVGEPAAVHALPAPGPKPADTPAFASLGDPLDGPIEERPPPLDEHGEPMIDENDPLGLGLIPVPAPEEPEPAAPPVSDTWLADWITGDWAMSPSALDLPSVEARSVEARSDAPDPLATVEPSPPAVVPAAPRPSPRPEPPAEPDPTRTGRRRATEARQAFPASEEPRASPAVDRPAPAPRSIPPRSTPAERPQAAGPPTVDPTESSLEQSGFVLRPESVARLSEADRELLARLQAELADTPRPRVTRRAGIAGSNGAAAHGGPAAPPDMAG